MNWLKIYKWWLILPHNRTWVIACTISVQDTIVCLLAITRYMKLTFSSDQNTVTFRSEQSNEIFQINNDNRLLVQRLELTKAHGQYTVDVEGHGCTFIQVIEINLRRHRKMFTSELASDQLFNCIWRVILPFCIVLWYLYSCSHTCFLINSRKYKLFYEESLTYFYEFILAIYTIRVHFDMILKPRNIICSN